MVRKLRQVILGNSAAGLSAVTAIRQIDQQCKIVLASAERCYAYTPVLTTYYLAKKIGKEEMFIADSKFYKEKNVKTILGDKAVGLDPSRQIIYLESGKEVAYDNALIATGASPRKLKVMLRGSSKILFLRTLQDAERIAELAKTAKEIVIIGGGLVSLQAANALHKQDVRISLVVNSEQLLSQNVDAHCAEIIQAEMESQGISIHLRSSLKKVGKRKGRIVIVLDSGPELQGDMVIVGKGVDPNIEWLRDSGVRLNRGVLVNEFMQSNFPNIFAAGDVAESENGVTGQTEVVPGWGKACVQGKVAGLNMMGRQERYIDSTRENVSTLFGLTVASIRLGDIWNSNKSEELKFFDPRTKVYRKILFAGNRIVGAILLGKTEDAGIIRNLINSKVDISPWKEEIGKTPLNLRGPFLNRLLRFRRLF